MEDRLAAASADIRTEAVTTERGPDGGLKVSRQRLQRSPPALLKYSPAYFTLVSVTGGASLRGAEVRDLLDLLSPLARSRLTFTPCPPATGAARRLLA